MKHQIVFEDVYFDSLRDLYDAENQIIEALPKMIEKVSSPELKAALEEHLKVTEEQSGRLEQIFASFDQESKGKSCEGMKGLIKEAEKHLKELKGADPALLDAVIIAGAQKVEHYEICGYGTARTFGMHLNDTGGCALLEKSLAEEKDADKKLTEIAETKINLQAVEATSSAD